MELYPIHPLADCFPRMPGPEFVLLKKDIRENGLIEPIWVYDGKVLDGRHRQFACQEVGVEPRYRKYEGTNPIGFVASLNINRRHLSESQRAMAAASLEGMQHGGNRKAQQDANLHLDRNQAAELLQVSPRSVATAAKVKRSAPAEVVEAVKNGNISLNMAAQVAELPEEEREEVAHSDNIKDAATKAVKKHRHQSKPKTGEKAESLREEIKAAQAKGYSMLASHCRLLLSTLSEQSEFSQEERDLLDQVVSAINKL